jgi:hypothetical protein
MKPGVGPEKGDNSHRFDNSAPLLYLLMIIMNNY